MDGIRDRLLATYDACHCEAYRLAVLLTGDSSGARLAVVSAFTDLAHELSAGGWVASTRARLFHHVMRRAQVPEGEADDADPVDELVAVVRSLPNQQRRAVVLHCGLGLDGADLASALDLPTSQAVSQLRRGIAAIAARLESRR